MRMLSDVDSLAGGGGGGDQGGSSSAAPATAAPPPLVVSPLSAWAVAASQGQLTPAGTRSSTTGTGLLIILAALLCALVGGFSFPSLLRCALHYCGGGGGRRGALPPARLKESALRRMPVAVYEVGAPGSAAPAGAECAICLGEFADGDAVHLLPRCRHGFHVRCIDTWLSAHSSCPICRDSLLDDDEGAAAGEEETTVAAEGTYSAAPRAWLVPEFTIGI